VTAITLSFPQPHIALLSFNLPGKSANVLSAAVMEELAAQLQTLEQTADLQGVILTSAKPGTFLAGADIREFVGVMDSPPQVAELCRRGHAILGRLAALPAVTIAAIEGACLGGGMELALACDRRIVAQHPKTQLGLPEVKLGLIPGWGGCARLPRLVGLPAAVEMITTGKTLSASAAVDIGLADDSVAGEKLVSSAIELAGQESISKDYLRNRERRAQGVSLGDTELEFLRFTTAAKLAPDATHQPAAMTALNLLIETARDDLPVALEKEIAAFGQVFGSPANRALVHVFLLQDYNKRDSRSALQTKPTESISVLGAGIMGIGIAASALKAGVQVRLGDADQAVLTKAAEDCLLEAAFDPATKATDPARLPQLGARLSSVTTDAELAASDVVIEAIVENLEIKIGVLRRLEALLGPQAILASNTSSIPISKIASGLARPERFCGMHFFNPVKLMRLVEVVRGSQTSDETIALAIALGRKMGKMPIVVQDGPGFLVNRLLSPYLNEAIELLHDGHSPAEVDAAAVEYGMPLGPLALYDLVGLDTAFYAGRTMYEAFPDRVRASPILPALIKKGRLGRKNHAGFYAYQPGVLAPQPDPAAAEILQKYVRTEHRLTLPQIQDRLLLTMLLEACRVLEEGRVHDPRDIDLGVIFGLGFPTFRGGILHWAQQQGGAEILRKLEPCQGRGNRFTPPQVLIDWAAGKRKLTA
jgi:3-hydroxyacyl-CoA dehydrogenase/enoyl-CoA hydratase/3-hydroxybutyryl-CoA epimerase/3-hydroxyacyl-CoA dehydrogenase/enoyl-CoA hydratase/3-hydroxybutyryl-CoA epimerase/enoyl-CoA isomerase